MGRPALNDNARYAYKYLIDTHGLQPHQAAGIVGNLMQESTMNTGARNPGDGRDGTDSIGIAQWNSDRARNLRQFAGDQVHSLDRQLDFVIHEMKNGGEQAAWKQLQAAQDIPGATAAMISYERPQGWSRDNPMGGHGWDNRLAWAAEIGGMDPAQFQNIQAQSNPVAVAQAPGSQPSATPTPAVAAATPAPETPSILGLNINTKGLPQMLQFAQMAAGPQQQEAPAPQGGLLPSRPVEIATPVEMQPRQTFKPWESMLGMYGRGRA